jgi:transposase-like protein
MVDMRMDPAGWLRKKLEESAPDLLRELLFSVIDQLMNAEVDVRCGAGYRERSGERTNSRNGHRDRRFDTRLGTGTLRIPKLRQGSYFPDWLLEPRRRSERALVEVVSEAFVQGVSTRRMESLVQSLGIDGISKSQVSDMAKHLDSEVQAFRDRPLDSGPYRYLWLDALVVKSREGGRIVNLAVVVATAVNADGRREILGLDVFTREDGAAWTAFLRGLVARGLSGVELATSDAHEGLKAAIGSVLPGASWQRCRTHFARNLLTRVPKSAQDLVASLLRSVFAQPSPEEVHAQFDRVLETLLHRFPAAGELLADARHEILAFTAFPKAHWRQIWSNNPQERLNREIRRRTDIVGIFPNRDAILRLVGAVLAEQHDEWAVARRYMTLLTLAPPIDADRELDPALPIAPTTVIDKAA